MGTSFFFHRLTATLPVTSCFLGGSGRWTATGDLEGLCDAFFEATFRSETVKAFVVVGVCVFVREKKGGKSAGILRRRGVRKIGEVDEEEATRFLRGSDFQLAY